MKLFIQAKDYEVCRVIMNDPLVPLKKVEKRELVKEESVQDANDIKMAKLNAKELHTLFCALRPIENNRVSLYDNAKKAWDKLEVTHEYTNQVKENKIGMLTLDYELFKMKSEETIVKMSNRFTIIITSLKAFGKTYGEEISKQLAKELEVN